MNSAASIPVIPPPAITMGPSVFICCDMSRLPGRAALVQDHRTSAAQAFHVRTGQLLSAHFCPIHNQQENKILRGAERHQMSFSKCCHILVVPSNDCDAARGRVVSDRLAGPIKVEPISPIEALRRRAYPIA